MSYRVTTISTDGREVATFSNEREARDHMASVADLFGDEGIRYRGSVCRSNVVKIVDTIQGETIALIRIEGIN